MTSLSQAAAVALGSAVLCLMFGRVMIRQLAQAQCLAPTRYEDCPPLQSYQATKPPTPTMGGLFVLAAAVIAAGLAGGLRAAEGWLVLAAALGLGLVGALDDWMKFRRPNAKGLPAMPRLYAALAVGAGIGVVQLQRSETAGVLTVPWLQTHVSLGWGWVLLAMVVVAGCTHAVNLTDGMDGLAAGCAALVFVLLGFWALPLPHAEVLVPWCAAFAGACLGFLWFNGYPATVFLGDVGALGLGAALGTLSLLTQTPLLLAIVGGVFVVEALSVMLQVASYRFRNKQRIFRVAPIHHHFHLGGIPEPKLIVRFWVAGALLALLGLTGHR